ncbi:MAG: AAA family ATPase [Gammaproteobacteria bacterium]|nr:AAA family ATPase [Gammaproteobacteria bacterium]
MKLANATKVLIAGHSEAGLKSVQAMIESVPDCYADSFLMVNGNADPMCGLTEKPDVLILHSSDGVGEDLKSLAKHPQRELPDLLLVGNDLSAAAVKFAVRAGVKDIVAENDVAALTSALSDLSRERDADGNGDSVITAVINAKGGSGATFIAANIAHIAATRGSGGSVVIDLDFQFGSLSHYFDRAPKRSLLDALAHVHELDRVAVEAYTAEHPSGLSIMAPLPDMPTSVDFDIGDRVRALLPVLKSRFRQTVFDVPRHLGEVTYPVLQGADHVLMVLQQSLPSVRDAVRLRSTMVRELGIDESRVHAVVNRYHKSGTIELNDIKDALGQEKLLVVANHFKSVGQSIDMGVPIAEFAPSSPVVKGLVELAEKFTGGLAPTGNDRANAIGRLRKWSRF